MAIRPRFYLNQQAGVSDLNQQQTSRLGTIREYVLLRKDAVPCFVTLAASYMYSQITKRPLDYNLAQDKTKR